MLKENNLLFFLILAVYLIIPTGKAFADKDGFIYVTPNLDENLQISGESYINYDVKGKEGESINSSFIISNLADEPIKVDVNVKNGLTNTSGEVYDHQIENKLSGFLNENYLMNNYVKNLPDLIELGPNESKEFSFVIEVPKNLKGRVIGGLGFIKQNKEKSEGSSIELKQEYLFSIWLNGEKEATVPIEITDLDVNLDTKNPILYSRIENNNSNFLKDEDINYEVVKKEDNSIVFNGEKNIRIISPKNYFNLAIQWDGEFGYGKYLLNINDQIFDFEITKEDVKKIVEKNDPTISINDSSIPFWTWVLIGVLVLTLISFLIYFMVNRRKK